MRRRYVLAWLVLMLLLAVPCGRVAEARREPPTLCDGAEAMLDAQGFAVCPGGVGRMHAPYRWPKGPVFVTADAGLSGYLLCLRRLLLHETGGYDDRSLPLLKEWGLKLVATDEPGQADPARKVVSLLLRLHRDTPSADADVEAEFGRLRSGDATHPFLGLGVPLDRRPIRELWAEGMLPAPERFQVLLFVLTRAGIADAALRGRLQQTLPEALRALVTDYVERVGELAVSFPGERGVIDIRLRGDERFPPGVLGEDPELYALDYGARIGLRWATEDLGRRGVAEAIQPVVEEPQPGSLRGTLDVVFREIPGKPEGTPALFESAAWERLELQTLLGAQVLWRRAVGTATGASKVFGASDHPGFVHPDPGFWKALSELAKRTAEGARQLGVRWHVPSAEIMDSLEASARLRLEREEPFSAREKFLFQRCGVGSWHLMWVLGWGDEHYHQSDAKGQAIQRREVERVLFGGDRWKGLFAGIREGRTDVGPPSCVRYLDKLAETAVKLAGLAKHQLARTDAPDAKDVLSSFGFLMEDIEAAYQGPDDPLVTCARALIDGNQALYHGLGHADTLWVRYPWKDEVILCRGAVFSYREVVSSSFLGESLWKERMHGETPPRRPTWAKAFLATE